MHQQILHSLKLKLHLYKLFIIISYYIYVIYKSSENLIRCTLLYVNLKNVRMYVRLWTCSLLESWSYDKN